METIDNLIKNFPEATRSPLGVLAFVIALVVCAWTAYRLRRLKHMRYLDKVRPTDRVEYATIVSGEPSPPKMSPKQYIKYKRGRDKRIFFFLGGLALLFAILWLAARFTGDSNLKVSSEHNPPQDLELLDAIITPPPPEERGATAPPLNPKGDSRHQNGVLSMRNGGQKKLNGQTENTPMERRGAASANLSRADIAKNEHESASAETYNPSSNGTNTTHDSILAGDTRPPNESGLQGRTPRIPTYTEENSLPQISEDQTQRRGRFEFTESDDTSIPRANRNSNSLSFDLLVRNSSLTLPTAMTVVQVIFNPNSTTQHNRPDDNRVVQVETVLINLRKDIDNPHPQFPARSVYYLNGTESLVVETTYWREIPPASVRRFRLELIFLHVELLRSPLRTALLRVCWSEDKCKKSRVLTLSNIVDGSRSRVSF